jgi:hypothetical protein
LFATPEFFAAIENRQTHRKAAKNAEKFFTENNQTLCVLCGFAALR